jgi:hypothetical protein
MQTLDINNDGKIDPAEQAAYLLLQENPQGMLTNLLYPPV